MQKLIKSVSCLMLYIVISIQVYGNDVDNYKKMLKEFQTANIKQKSDIIIETMKKCKAYDSKTINNIVEYYIKEYKKQPLFKKNIVNLKNSSDEVRNKARVKLSIIALMYYNYKLKKNKKAEKFINDLRQTKSPFIKQILSENDVLFKTEEDEQKECEAFKKLKNELKKLTNEELTNHLIEVIPKNKGNSYSFRIAVMSVILEKQNSFKITPDNKKKEIIKSIKKHLILEKDYGIMKNLVMLLRRLELDKNELKSLVQGIFKNKESSPKLKKLLEQIFYDFIPKNSKINQ